MATITWFMTNTNVGTNSCQEMSETSPGADATTSPNTGWTVAKVAANNSDVFQANVERAGLFALDSSFPSPPTLNPATDGIAAKALRTQLTYDGSFASANWTFNFVVRAVGSGGDQDGHILFRMYRGTQADGNAGTYSEITSARQVCSNVVNLLTTVDQNSTLAFNPGAITLTNEYLFVTVGWFIDGAGGANTRDVIFRIGNTATRIISSDFTAGGSGSTYTKAGFGKEHG